MSDHVCHVCDMDRPRSPEVGFVICGIPDCEQFFCGIPCYQVHLLEHLIIQKARQEVRKP